MDYKESYTIYKELVSKYSKLNGEVVDDYAKKLQEVDAILPPMESYTMLINVPKSTHEFISKNVAYTLGYSLEEIEENGQVEFLISKFHPDDLKIWVGIIEEMMQVMLSKVKVEDRNKLNASYNYRIKRSSGDYINIQEQLYPIYFDHEDIPVIMLAHCTVIGYGQEYPLIGHIRKLNAANVYETLFFKNFSRESLQTKLTNREIDVLRLIAMRKTSKEIADKLFISSHTVDGHRRKLLKKMNFQSTGEIIQYCKENFLI